MNQTTSSPNLLAAIALTLIPGIGPKLTRQLISYCGSAEAVLRAPSAKLRLVPGIGASLTQELAGSRTALLRAEEILRRCEHENVRVLWYQNADFPQRLLALPDAPSLLYCQGAADLDAPRTIALVGTRQATDYGRRVTDKLIHGLAHYVPLVISGMAYGIDIFAHRAAIEAGLPTVGVLAGGLDRLYPAEHRRTADRIIADGGALVTEYPFGVIPAKMQFPARNRIIAGLAEATIVVEAGEKGGALITADLANDYDRTVLAVPGDVFAPWSVGCNQYIRDTKAAACLSADDVVIALNWDGALYPTAGRPSQGAVTPPNFNLDDFSTDEATVLRALLTAPDYADHIDGLSWRTQLPMSTVSGALLTLELASIVNAMPGKIFRINL
jgi:DNA processing protein